MAQPDPAPLPTLDDVQALTPASDFKPFMLQGVAPDVRNAAMKKLFADPHFNVMDRLDIYIDDYSQPDPLPAAMLRQMASAKILNLFDEENDGARIPPRLGMLRIHRRHQTWHSRTLLPNPPPCPRARQARSPL